MPSDDYRVGVFQSYP